MQDITEEICAATPEGREAQLEDKRDGNKYWVGKMKDDRCWMLQNLALGSTSSDTVLTSADSDVSSDWNLPASKTAPSGSTSATAVQSWNFGKWVLATPLLTTDCGNSTAGQSISRCTRVGFVDVSSSNFQPTYTAITGSWGGANANSSTLVAVNCMSWSGSGTSKICTAGTYDPHYLTGNWYSWNAATAGTGGTKTSGQAAGSICPKGWRLPTGGSSGELAGLLSKYGVSSSLSGTVDGTNYNIAGSPLRFVRGGVPDVTNNFLSVAGKDGRYWTSTANSDSTLAHRFNFTNSTLSTAARNYRYGGLSVRCVAEWTYSGNTVVPFNT